MPCTSAIATNLREMDAEVTETPSISVHPSTTDQTKITIFLN